MSSFNVILSSFRALGLSENSSLSKNQVINTLDALCKRNAPHLGQFQRSISEQLWEETPKISNNRVMLNDFINTILKGESIVSIEIEAMDDEIRRQTNELNKQEKLQQLILFVEDQRYLTEPFGWKIPNQSKQNHYLKNSTQLQGTQLRASRRSISSESTVIFARNHNQYKGRGSSRDLIVVIIILILCIIMEMFIMFDKHHFENLMAYFAISCIFICNYFDKYYIRFVLSFLGISQLMDFLWLIIETKEYWHPAYESQHSFLEVGYAEFMVMLVVILFLLKAVVFLILLKYRSNPQTISKNVRFLGCNFPLDGFHNSPIALAFNKGIGNTSSY